MLIGQIFSGKVMNFLENSTESTLLELQHFIKSNPEPGLFHSQLCHFIYLREYLIASFRQRIFSYL